MLMWRHPDNVTRTLPRSAVRPTPYSKVVSLVKWSLHHHNLLDFHENLSVFITGSCDVRPCNSIWCYHRFGGTFCSVCISLKQYVPSKWQYPATKLHGVMSQESFISRIIATRTSSPIHVHIFRINLGGQTHSDPHRQTDRMTQWTHSSLKTKVG